MGDPAGYLDEGKGLPWITMDYHGLPWTTTLHSILPGLAQELVCLGLEHARRHLVQKLCMFGQVVGTTALAHE